MYGLDEGTYTYDELAALTKSELLIIAEEKGIEGISMSNLKEEIIEAILGAQNKLPFDFRRQIYVSNKI